MNQKLTKEPETPDFTQLGTCWHIDGDTATRGTVTIKLIDGLYYRAKATMLTREVTVHDFTAQAAMNALRAHLARLMDDLATALADIDAPEAPEVTP